jgi:hypothetical protein
MFSKKRNSAGRCADADHREGDRAWRDLCVDGGQAGHVGVIVHVRLELFEMVRPQV